MFINIDMKIKLPPELLWLCPVDCPDLIRLGHNMDGGYIIPRSVMEKSDGLLSMGLGDDWTFDNDWHQAKPNDPIHMYDGSVSLDSLRININAGVRRHLDIKSMYSEFFKDNRKHFVEHVGGSSTSLATCLERIGVPQVFIKIDIEGGEYAMIDDFISNKDRITGFAMEIHGAQGVKGKNGQFDRAVEQLSEHYNIVHIHANNHVSSDEYSITGCFEITWARKDLCPNTKLRYDVYLPGIDFPNVHGKEDAEYYFDPVEQ